jgi:predicted deacylase
MDYKKNISKEFTEKNGRKFTVTYYRINGAGPGPVLTLLAGQHGMEHSGPNILHQFIRDIDPASFNGTIQVCPCANPLALELDYEIYPENYDISRLDNYFYSQFRHDYCIFGLGRNETQSWFNMNRLWNCETVHGVAGQITRWLWQEIVSNANLVIDMHCLQAEKPLIYTADKRNLPWARCFGIEAIIMCPPKCDDYNQHNLLRQVNSRPDQHGFCVEFSRQHGLKQSEYPLGAKGIDNMMKALGMKAGDIVNPRPVYVFEYKKPFYMKARHSGHVRYFVELYGTVKKGDKIYEIWDPQTLKTLENGFAPVDGVMGEISHKPVIKADDVLGWMASPVKIAEAGKNIEKPQYKITTQNRRKYYEIPSNCL